MTQRLSSEDRFHMLLGRLVHAFARFDFNIGLQLRHIAPYCNEPLEEMLRVRTPFAQRLRALEPLLMVFFEEAGPEASTAFKSWMQRANEAKALRNDYVHGRWNVLPLHLPDGPMLEFVALNWETDPKQQEPTVRMGFEQLENEVKTLESLFADFQKLERRFSPRVTKTIAPPTSGST